MAGMARLPRAILFDLDETILSFPQRTATLRALAEAHREHLGPHPPEAVVEAVERAFAEFWSDAARHKLWRFRLAEARSRIVAEVFAALSAEAPSLTPDVAAAFAERFHAERERGVCIFPGACETLDALKARGVTLALVTNGDAETQRAKITQFDLERRFDHVQIEGEHGFGKPDERAYRHALQTLGCEPCDAWMVGDNLEWEVVAPQKLGIYAVWCDPYGRGLPEGSGVRPDRIVRSLPELLEGLEASCSAARPT